VDNRKESLKRAEIALVMALEFGEKALPGVIADIGTTV
jgi:hypothetical protein